MKTHDAAHAARCQRHWEMLQHLTWELQTGNWPYAHRYPHLVGRQVARPGVAELLDYARYDPRFVAAGLSWHQPPCVWRYVHGDQTYTGPTALIQFLGIDGGNADLLRMLEAEIKAGALRLFAHRQVARFRRRAGDLEPYEFHPDKSYAHMLEPALILDFTEPDWLGTALETD